MDKKKLIIRKPDCEANKTLTFNLKVEGEEVKVVDAFLSFLTGEGKTKNCLLDKCEIAYYQERFWKEFEQILEGTQRQLTVRKYFI